MVPGFGAFEREGWIGFVRVFPDTKRPTAGIADQILAGVDGGGLWQTTRIDVVAAATVIVVGVPVVRRCEHSDSGRWNGRGDHPRKGKEPAALGFRMEIVESGAFWSGDTNWVWWSDP